jgi:SAM-dependent methyltransferase
MSSPSQPQEPDTASDVLGHTYLHPAARPEEHAPLQTEPALAAAHLYNERFKLHGRDIRTVGWGSSADQVLRFDVLFRGLDPRGKTILDVGCGLGDLVPYLQERTGGEFSYFGVDVAEKLIIDARNVHGSNSCRFLHGDAFRNDLPQVDIAVLSGALSMRTQGIIEYAKATLERMYLLAQEAACLNFLSKYVDFELEKNQHYQPEAMFAWARGITRRVNLFHDYPLYEFTLQMLRSPTNESS